ncbi:leucine-rich alpha-2-glycoprotein-like isoform X1 [Mytilus edulis]|uniref:leucine-rich alpha-2-glycoprotein-like isoform X1 n=1 Tax=Mytilus edulis TaxID=6550 RepID=UPI0039EFA9FC
MHLCISIHTELMGFTFVKWMFVQDRHLYSNQMRTLSANLFQGLTSLQDLNLNRKLITIIVTNLFQWSEALGILTLKSNRITTLDGNLFQGLTALQHLKHRVSSTDVTKTNGKDTHS